MGVVGRCSSYEHDASAHCGSQNLSPDTLPCYHSLLLPFIPCYYLGQNTNPLLFIGIYLVDIRIVDVVRASLGEVDEPKECRRMKGRAWGKFHVSGDRWGFVGEMEE